MLLYSKHALLTATVAWLLMLYTPPTRAAEFKLGVVLPYTLNNTAIGSLAMRFRQLLELSLPLLNRDIAQPNGHSFSLHFRSSEYLTVDGVTAALELQDQGVVGIIGPMSTDTSMNVANALARRRVFQCSGSATGNPLADKSNFKYFYRTIPSDSYQSLAILAALRHLKWTLVHVLSESSGYAAALSSNLTASASLFNVSIASHQHLPPSTTDADVATILKQFEYTSSRIIVFLGGDTGLLQAARVAANILKWNPLHWQFVGSEVTELIATQGRMPAEVQALLQGMLVARPMERVNSARLNDLDELWQATFNNTDLRDNCVYCLFFHTCLEAQMRGILQVVAQFGEAAVLNRAHNATIQDVLTQFDSISGPVEFTSEGERRGHFQLSNLQGSSFVRVFTVPENLTLSRSSNPIVFGNGLSTPPPWHQPTVNFVVDYDQTAVIVIMTLISVTMAAILIAMGIVWKYRKTKRIKHIGVPYLVVLSVGQLCVLLAIHAWLGAPSVFKCVLEDQLVNFGQSMILSSIAVKAYRVMIVYDNRVLAKSINRNSLLGLIAVNPLIQLVLIIIAETFAPGAPALKLEKGVARFECVRSAQPLGSVLDLCNFCAVVLLLLVTAILLYKVRRVQTTYMEIPYLSLSVQHLGIAMLIVTPIIILVPMDPWVGFYVKATSTLLPIWTSLYCITARHISHLLRSAQEVENESAVGIHSRITNFNGNGTVAGSTSSTGEKSIGVGARLAKTATGVFAMKAGNSFMSIWRNRSLTLFVTEGILIVGNEHAKKPGTALVTTQLVISTHNPDLPICMALAHPGFDPLVIQFQSDKEFSQWNALISSAGAVQKGSGTSSTSGDQGGSSNGAKSEGGGGSGFGSSLLTRLTGSGKAGKQKGAARPTSQSARPLTRALSSQHNRVVGVAAGAGAAAAASVVVEGEGGAASRPRLMS